MNTVRNATIAFNRCRSSKPTEFAARLTSSFDSLITGPIDSMHDLVACKTLISSLSQAANMLPLSKEDRRILHLFSYLWNLEASRFICTELAVKGFTKDCAMYAATSHEKPSGRITEALLSHLALEGVLHTSNGNLYVSGLYFDGDSEMKAYQIFGLGLRDVPPPLLDEVTDLNGFFTAHPPLDAISHPRFNTTIEKHLLTMSQETDIIPA